MEYPQLSKLDNQFLHQLEILCKIHKDSKEYFNNPKWLQLREIQQDKLVFVSSQTDRMTFDVWFLNLLTKDEIEELTFDFSSVYEYFKKLKYDFLENNFKHFVRS